MKTTTFRMCTLLAASLLAAPLASAQIVGPGAPTDLLATPTAPGEITLAWQPAPSLTGVTAYRVYHVEADGNLTPVVDVPADQLSLVETGIPRGTSVTYAVSALDVLGEGPTSEPVTATTWDVPSAPTGLAVASGPGLYGEATLSWAAPEADGGAAVLGYVVYRDGAPVAWVDAATLTYTDVGLAPLQRYAFSVSAVNAVGEGPRAEACGMASPWAHELGCGLTL